MHSRKKKRGERDSDGKLSPAMVRASLAAARTSANREALLDRILRMNGAKTTSARLSRGCVECLVELVRHPAHESRFDLSQETAMAELIRARSRAIYDVLVPHASSPFTRLRATTGRMLAWSGRDAAWPLIRRFVLEDSHEVARETVQGLGLSALHKLLPRSRRSGAFLLLARWLTGAHSSPANEAAEDVRVQCARSITLIDRTRAKALLASHRVLRPENLATRAALFRLYHIAEEELAPPKVDARLLWPLIEAARALRPRRSKRFHHDQIVGIGLVLAARTDPARVRQEAAEVIRRAPQGWSQLRDFAREAMRACRGIPESGAVLRRWQGARSRFKGPARHVLAAFEFATEVNNEGYFTAWHNLGHTHTEVANGLTLLSLPAERSIIGKSASLLGLRKTMLTERHVRDRIAAIQTSASKPFALLAASFEEATERMFATTQAYIARYPERFR